MLAISYKTKCIQDTTSLYFNTPRGSIITPNKGTEDVCTHCYRAGINLEDIYSNHLVFDLLYFVLQKMLYSRIVYLFFEVLTLCKGIYETFALWKTISRYSEYPGHSHRKCSLSSTICKWHMLQILNSNSTLLYLPFSISICSIPDLSWANNDLRYLLIHHYLFSSAIVTFLQVLTT